MTIDELVEKYRESEAAESAWVDEGGFSRLHVTVGPMHLCGVDLKSIQLADMEANQPGKGALTELVTRLREQYPRYPVFIEGVSDPRFAKKLKEIGFIQASDNKPPSFLLI